MPKILLNAMRNRAEGTSGKLSAVAERQRAETEAALDDARRNVERLKAPSVSLPSTNLPAGRTVLEMRDVGFAHPDGVPLFDGLDLVVAGPERVALTGVNSSGKTTLLRLITGEIEPQSGRVRRTPRMAMLDQHAADLDRQETIRDNFRRLNPADNENACRAALARFLFRAGAALQPVGSLSGGERLRAALACTLGGGTPPELLILDEPTNHLDLQAIAAIEAGLVAYDGALLIASHDEDFLQAVGITRRIELPLEQRR